MSCIADVGTPSSNFQGLGWERAEVRFHGFAELPAEPGDDEVVEFTCLGHPWILKIYPGGYGGYEEVMVALCLFEMSDKPIKMKFRVSIKDSDGKETADAHDSFSADDDWHWSNGYFAERSTILKSLVEGTLIIEVQMRLADPTKTIPPPFIPKNPACNYLQKVFMDEESSDVIFEVLQKGGNSKKKAKTSSTTFHAHRLILQQCAPQLAELCGPIENVSSPVSISIPDVTSEIFHHILHYIYGGEVPNDDMKDNAKEIINATDKYGVFNLKLEAEACLVKSTTIDVENMMDLLLYADSKNCALLKEAVMDFAVANEIDIIKKVSFKDAPGEMIKDVLAAVARKRMNKKGDAASNEDEFFTMRITELRRKVHEKGLEVDGSREMLIASLKESA